MGANLGCSTHPNMPRSELVLQPSKDSLDTGSLAISSPINRVFWVSVIDASCTKCGNSKAANSANARENVDSCGRSRLLFQPQILRSCASFCNRSRNCVVVQRSYTALATKAQAIA